MKITSRLLLFFVLILLVQPCPAQQGIEQVPSTLLTDVKTYDSQPSALMGKDGTIWVAWVGNTNANADRIYVRSRTTNGWGASEVVTSATGQYVQPKLAQDARGRIWAFWSTSRGLRASVREGGKWSAPKALTTGSGPDANPAVCSDARGKVWFAWQSSRNGSYDIFLKSYYAKSWSADIVVTKTPGNEWHPAIAADSKGGVWVAWSAYENKQYSLQMSRYSGGKPGPVITIARDGRYNLNPSICVDNRDRVWLAWDSISLRDHGRSGHSTITGANVKGMGVRKGPDEVVSLIKLACYDGKRLSVPRIPRSPGSMVGEEFTEAHGGKPTVAVDARGNAYLFHRARTLHTPPKRFYWLAQLERYSGGEWLPSVVLSKSEGSQEPISVVQDDKAGLLAVYQNEYRENRGASTEGVSPGLLREGFVGNSGANGDIFAASVPLLTASTDLAKAMIPTPAPGKTVSLPSQQTRHAVRLKGKTYKLYWGDLHKHSHYSGCSNGTEPSPEDVMMYGQDVCRYDFMSMTDHAEHMSNYSWWRAQELTDLRSVPGAFVTMSGYEWTAQFPIGHKNVIFPGPPAPNYRSWKSDAPKLWAALQRTKALTIPHTTSSGMGTDWSDDNAEFQRLVEIFQAARGSCELEKGPRLWWDVNEKVGFVQQGLAKGCKMGFICGSDHGYQVSYACVYADKLDRHSIFDALYNRRCYGSTAYGTVLDFRINGSFMGQTIKAGGPRNLQVYASAPARFRSVEVIRNGDIVHSQGSAEKPIGKKEIKLTWRDSSPFQGFTKAGEDYYYVRVIREDDEIAWSSPIWVDG